MTLREKIGHDPLWLSGVCAVVLDSQGRVLLTRRADTGRWSLISGILEPGEQPARALVREIREETGIEAEVERLASVLALEPMVVPNGDRCQFLSLTFRCRHLSGEPYVADDENLEVAWFPVDQLPAMSASAHRRLAAGLLSEGPADFER